MKTIILTSIISLMALSAWGNGSHTSAAASSAGVAISAPAPSAAAAADNDRDSRRSKRGKTARVSVTRILKGTPLINDETGQVTANIEKSSKVYELQKGEEAGIFVADKVGKESVTLKSSITLMDQDTQRKGKEFELKKGKLMRLVVCDLLDATETYTLLCEDVW